MRRSIIARDSAIIGDGNVRLDYVTARDFGFLLSGLASFIGVDVAQGGLYRTIRSNSGEFTGLLVFRAYDCPRDSNAYRSSTFDASTASW